MSKALFKNERFRFLFFIVILVVVLIIDQVFIQLYKKHQVMYIAAFHRLIVIPNTFALDSTYTANHPGVSLFGSKKGDINIGYNVSSIPQFIERMNKDSTIINETKCGVEIHKFMNIKQTNQNTIMLEDDKEYLLFSQVDEKVMEQVIRHLCDKYPGRL